MAVGSLGRKVAAVIYGDLCQLIADLQEGGTRAIVRLRAAIQARAELWGRLRKWEVGRRGCAHRIHGTSGWLAEGCERKQCCPKPELVRLILELPHHLADPQAETMFLMTLKEWEMRSRKADTHPLCSGARGLPLNLSVP